MAMRANKVDDEDATGVGWTHLTWNPWQGCDHVSPGCDLCYMYTEKRRYGQDPTRVVRSAKTTFEKPFAWARKYPEGRMVFTCSWSDFFHADADPWRDEAWSIMRATPHIYQIVTKRIARVPRCLPSDWGDGYPNVAIGVSAEDQSWAERRVPLLLNPKLRVRWRFVSYEPALGPIDFTRIKDKNAIVRAVGAEFYDALAGASCWKEDRSIYIPDGPVLSWLILIS